MDDRGLEEGLLSVVVLETLCSVLDRDIIGLSINDPLVYKRYHQNKSVNFHGYYYSKYILKEQFLCKDISKI